MIKNRYFWRYEDFCGYFGLFWVSDSDVRHKGKCTECEYFGRILKFQIFLGVCLIFFL